MRILRGTDHAARRMKQNLPRISTSTLLALLVCFAADGLRAEGVPPPTATPTVPVAEILPVPQKIAPRDRHQRHADEFFAGPIVHLEFIFKPADWESLKKDNRRYAECTMIETAPDGMKTEYASTAVKLKGSAGSFQGPDQKPGLTVSLHKFKGGGRFHGMEKFHLNNGAQDASLLNEFMGGEMCRAAGVPASRCTHAIVKWNGRDMGLYLFKEGFTRDFLTYFYEQPGGALYDGHFIAEIDGNMEKQLGGDSADSRDRMELAAACKEGDAKVRWQKVGERVDIGEYLRFLAMETFLCHWDGYNFNRNNYRLYFDAKTGKANFFCHGMDQLFGDAGWPVVRDPASLVGAAVWGNPDWKAGYLPVAKEIYEKVLKPVDWDARIVAQGAKVKEALTRVNPQWGKDYEGQIKAARDRVGARLVSIGKQFGDLPKPFDWVNGVAKLGPKHWNSQGGGAFDEPVNDGQHCLHIRADGTAAASWRRTVSLPPGRYRFEATVKTADVAAGGDDTGEGAGLRISGGKRRGVNGVNGANGLTGSAAWQTLGYEFDAAGSDVILVAEVRSGKGEMWLQHDSLQLVKLK